MTKTCHAFYTITLLCDLHNPSSHSVMSCIINLLKFSLFKIRQLCIDHIVKVDTHSTLIVNVSATMNRLCQFYYVGGTDRYYKVYAS